MTEDIVFADLQAQLRLLALGELSARELTGAYLDRIAKLNADLRGYATVDPDAALDQADAADDARRRGNFAPLLGAPLALKDIIDTADLPTTYGSAAFVGHRPEQDATCVARLRRAGAVILGKANTFEFALSEPSPVFRNAKNPWAPRHVAGGSSNGSATVVAAGIAGASLGTDTAGSIRNPAAYCGVVGLKPTHGRVSIAGVGCLAYTMDTVGPMTRSVGDAALLLETLAGYDPGDPESADVPASAYTRDLTAGVRGLRIGLPTGGYFVERTSAVMRNAWRAAADALVQDGAELVEVDIGDMSPTEVLWPQISQAEAASWHEASFQDRPHLYGRTATAMLDRARTVEAGDYVRAMRDRRLFARQVVAAMSGCDLLLTPTTPTPAFTFEEAKVQAVPSDDHSLDVTFATTGFTRPFSLTGQPALALPVGLSPEGLPLSVQLVGRPFTEALLLRVGHALERAVGFQPLPPGLP